MQRKLKFREARWLCQQYPSLPALQGEQRPVLIPEEPVYSLLAVLSLCVSEMLFSQDGNLDPKVQARMLASKLTCW